MFRRPFRQFLWFGQKTEVLPIYCHRRRVYILPTNHGLLFLGILFAMLLGSINYNNNLGFMLVFLLGGVALASMMHTYRNLLGLAIHAVSARPAFAGGVIRFEIKVGAGAVRRRAIGFVIADNPPALAFIPAGGEEVVEVTAAAENRGLFRPGRILVWTRYPLGLFRAWAVLTPDVACLVYPKPIAGPVRQHPGGGDGDGGGETNRSGADDFAGLKPYQPGDAINRIAWKSLSRGHGVFVREFTAAGGAAVMLELEDLPGRDLEWRLSRLCDMVLKTHAMNVDYGLRLPGLAIAPAQGDRHKHRCLKELAMYGK